MNNMNGPQIIITKSEKNPGIALALGLLFGPIGLMYASIENAIIVLIATIVLWVILFVISILTMGLGLILFIPFWTIQGLICGYLAYKGAKKYNEKLNIEAGMMYQQPQNGNQSVRQETVTVDEDGTVEMENDNVRSDENEVLALPAGSTSTGNGSNANQKIEINIPKVDIDTEELKEKGKEIAGEIQQKSAEMAEKLKPFANQAGAKAVELGKTMGTTANEAGGALKTALQGESGKKIAMVVGGVAMAGILAFAGYKSLDLIGPMRYESKAKSYVEIVLDTKPVFESLASLDKNYTDEKITEAKGKLQDALAKLAALEAELMGAEVPKKYSVEHIRMMKSIEAERSLLEICINDLEDPKKNTIKRIYLKPHYEMNRKCLNGVVIGSADFKSMSYQNKLLNKAMNNFEKMYVERGKKQEADNRAAKMTDAKKKQDEAKKTASAGQLAAGPKQAEINDAARSAKELSFITEIVNRKGGELAITGSFFNGYDKPVLRVADLHVEVVLINNGKEVALVRDCVVSDVPLGVKVLMPSAMSAAVINIPEGNFPKDIIADACVVRVSKIKCALGKPKA